jgi:F-type H+-transporting ATPase subunit alpha
MNKLKLSQQISWLKDYKFKLRISEQGKVVSVGDGIVWIKGLPSAAIDEILHMEDGSRAMVFHLTEQLVGAILLKQTEKLTAGEQVYHSGLTLSAPVGDKLLGRVIDPLGELLDDGVPIDYDQWSEIDILSPPITARDFVSRPLYTGNKILDSMIPIGRGQRQLIIGDNGLGKSSLVLDMVINQKNTDVICVYVMIGQERSNVVNAIQILQETNAINNTVVVVAEATTLPGLQYLAPFAGCTIAEYWMKQGKDVLVVYDDLTTHAHSYRELSLLLKRPPGREAYPADIFYLHSRLLERSTCFSHKLGGGSMTAFPIIATKEGEIATYIPTNLISITDGQIYFDAKLFAAGFFPAIDITKSVSRIGGKAQDLLIKNEAARMKLDYLQFLELEVFTHFGSRLDASMQQKIQRGRILRELLKQELFEPLTIEAQMGWLLAYNEGYFDNVSLENIAKYQRSLEKYVLSCELNFSKNREEWCNSIKIWRDIEGLK